MLRALLKRARKSMELQFVRLPLNNRLPPRKRGPSADSVWMPAPHREERESESVGECPFCALGRTGGPLTPHPERLRRSDLSRRER